MSGCSPRDEVEWGNSPCPPSEGGQVRGDESIKLRADASQPALAGTSPPPHRPAAGGTPPIAIALVGEMNTSPAFLRKRRESGTGGRT